VTLAAAAAGDLRRRQDGVALVGGCAGGQVLKFKGAAFACADDATRAAAAAGTVTSVSAAGR
jgi:hypothetical protein